LLRNGETRSAPAPDRPRDAAARTGAHGTDIAHAVDDGLAARGRRSNPNEETTCNPDS